MAWTDGGATEMPPPQTQTPHMPLGITQIIAVLKDFTGWWLWHWPFVLRTTPRLWDFRYEDERMDEWVFH